MAEVVVQISAEELVDGGSLEKAVDAFAKWTMDSGQIADNDDAPHVMMMTEFSGGEIGRKLVFQNQENAARFLTYWDAECASKQSAAG